jgi:hypothetical protein
VDDGVDNGDYLFTLNEYKQIQNKNKTNIFRIIKALSGETDLFAALIP